MARFDAFTQHERRVIREAMASAQSEFYDPGHTREDREVLGALLREIEDADLPFTFGETPAKPERIDTAAEKAKGPTQGVQQEAPERWEAYMPTRARTPSRGPTEAAAGGRMWAAPKSRTEPRGESGFLLIECAHCGDIHAFCAKQPITTYRCGKCRNITPLEDMHRLRVICECGGRFNYRTNIVTQQMDVNCYKCGCPVAVEWLERRGKYEPIGWAGARKDKGKGGRKK